MTKLEIKQRRALWHRRWLPQVRSKKARSALVILALVGVASLLLLVMPYLPKLRFWLFRPKIDAAPYVQAAEQKKQTGSSQPKTEIKEQGNRLVIPSIGVNAQIMEGANIYVIGKNQGVWHETKVADPTKPGNMVIAGHRWLYTTTNGGYFYSLPEVKDHDKIYVRWADKVYEYEVYNRRTVNPTQIDIRDNDPAVPHKLTMYTCYPLGSTAKRFVVEAKLIE